MQVGLDKGVLTLTVDHKEEKQDTGGGDEQHHAKWHRTERSRKFLQRRLRLPPAADTSAASATYSDGVLAIHFPKKDPESTTSIVIN